MKKKYFNVLFLILVLSARIIASGQSVRVMNELFGLDNEAPAKERATVVIDPGHGGRDPGKVGVNGVLEKDINLSVSLKLESLLKENDINVIMTRTEDTGLYSKTDSNKKQADMRKRTDIINNSGAVLAVSIHQNSFVKENVKGAQVFYHTSSPKGKELAEILQDQFIKTLKDGNTRKAKSNESYYMLRMTRCPLVIVECGYLSNYNEAELLSDPEYQERLAWAIHLGILRYLNKNSGPKQPMDNS